MSAPTPSVILPSTTEPVGPEKKHLFDKLRKIQETHGYLPTAELEKIVSPPDQPAGQLAKNEQTKLHLRDIHAVASFYPHFRLQPPAKVEVLVCRDMSCHLQGSSTLKASLVDLKQRRDKASNAESANELSIGDVSCLGRCNYAPALVVNGHYYDQISQQDALSEVEGALKGRSLEGRNLSPAAKPLQSDPYKEKPRKERYLALKTYANNRNPEGLLAILKGAGLQGMGGAGFPTNIKWDAVRSIQKPQKYVVCNADESEPGTIKDRFILTHLPHLVIEGIILAGLCVGATQGYLYLRHEYEEQKDILEREIKWCYEHELLGRDIQNKGCSFDLELFISPGGYICGEESALLEAIEGKRAEPRNKPPIVAEVGLWKMPTVVNNVETMAFAAAIAACQCQNQSSQPLPWQWKFVGVTGDVQTPGVFEVEIGTTYRKLIDLAGGMRNGGKLLAFAPSGPSFGFLPASDVDLSMDWKTKTLDVSDLSDKVKRPIMGSAAVVVFADDRCMLDMALNAARFYAAESCGKCVPCRIGSQKMVEILDRWQRAKYQKSDEQLVKDLTLTLRQTSICALGQSVPVPIRSVLKSFPGLVEEHARRQCRVCFKGDGV